MYWGGKKVLLQIIRAMNVLNAIAAHAVDLYANDVARTQAQASSDGDTHAVHVLEPAEANDGYLLILTNKVSGSLLCLMSLR